MLHPCGYIEDDDIPSSIHASSDYGSKSWAKSQEDHNNKSQNLEEEKEDDL